MAGRVRLGEIGAKTFRSRRWLVSIISRASKSRPYFQKLQQLDQLWALGEPVVSAATNNNFHLQGKLGKMYSIWKV